MRQGQLRLEPQPIRSQFWKSPKIAEVARENQLKSICLFSSAGIGELGIEAAGINIIVANELIPYRVALYRENFKSQTVIQGDIRQVQEDIVQTGDSKLKDEDLFLMYATPPCQGMSSNGMGRLKWEASQGRRENEDERNRLILPTLDIINKFRPRWIMFENVPGMLNTEIRVENNQVENIVECIERRLGPDYLGRAEVVACQDYGIPQRRKRLITIFTRDEKGKDFFKKNGKSFFPKSMREPQISLRDAIEKLPPLEAKQGKNENRAFHPQHYVPIMNPRKF